MADDASPSSIPFYRKPFFFILSVLLFWPLTLLSMWTGPTYYRSNGQYVPMNRSSKALVSVLILLAGSFAFAAILRGPDNTRQVGEAANNAGAPESAADQAQAEQASPQSQPPMEQPAAQPLLRFSTDQVDSFNSGVYVTAVSEPISIKRIVLNRRSGDRNCDTAVPGHTLIWGAGDGEVPELLQIGDRRLLGLPGRCGQSIVIVTLETDRGVLEYTLQQ